MIDIAIIILAVASPFAMLLLGSLISMFVYPRSFPWRW